MEPGGLQSIGSQRVEHDWVTKHSTAQERDNKSQGMPPEPESGRYPRGRVNKWHREINSKNSVLILVTKAICIYYVFILVEGGSFFSCTSKMRTINLSIFDTMLFFSLRECFLSVCLVILLFRWKVRGTIVRYYLVVPELYHFFKKTEISNLVSKMFWVLWVIRAN